MPQPKSPRSTSTRARRPAAASKGSATTKRAAAKPAAKRATAAKSSTRRAAPKRAAAASSSPDAAAQANLTQLRNTLRKGVVLTTDGVKAAMDDAVKRGRMTRKDATELTQHLISSGRSQADGFRADLEHMLGRGRSRATKSGDRVLREVDKARRRVGVGPSFPITRYDELNATQVQGRLGDLTPAQLRKVRDYERRHDNRKSVLGAIEKKLG
jgi:polyhydroxyalkanoate synthesis regulator phasin